ncbi:hypothetical protein Mlute_01166 [Meiothermus luteus]|jgi:uncharacterized membrane protein (UPF0127 family)|uniref:DUF192 domain-containing protein n=1 Tax=Meiothermus luteus TaxID=2026184 RepID=A0A399EUE8_9DEIN|nr:DUF192 domain-containing protein [Meiothermus luteus]RIH86719.1 hypothetical protein Mlute_01166 [Meiothermus luteus]RMH54187.1 MAG: DUF192 domain-containing protein [Deinococcota bacterium]
MKTPGQLRGYSALLVALAVCLATTGYFLAGRLAPPRPTPSSIPERVALLETPQGPLELPVYAPLNTAQGLLARGRLAEGRGIWYSFPEPRDDGWSNLGLKRAASVAFLDAQGQVLTILDLPACSQNCRSYYPSRVYRQVLEVPQGWFTRHGVRPGQTVRTKPIAP